MDSTIIKVHQNACGSRQQVAKQAIGKSAIGWSTKIHVVTDALGLPLHFFLTIGQRHDSQVAKGLLIRSCCQNNIMDGAYDSTALRKFIKDRGEKAIIPFRKRSIYPEEFDHCLYKERHLIECLFCRMKNYRKIATRYEKLSISFQSLIVLSFILIWLRF